MLLQMVPRAHPPRFGAKLLLKPWPLFTNVSPKLIQAIWMLNTNFIIDTRARPPSRTLVDPLDAFVASLPSKGLSSAAEDALAAADKTKELVAKAGRGAYVNQEDLKKREVPDPGAWGIWRILDGLRGFEA